LIAAHTGFLPVKAARMPSSPAFMPALPCSTAAKERVHRLLEPLGQRYRAG
jgi:hypothetical protein